MISQGQFNTLPQLLGGDGLVDIKDDATIATKSQLVFKQPPEFFYQGCLTMKIHRVLSWVILDYINANQTATAGLFSQVTGLIPL